jgi:hypothetical protein
MDWEPIVRRLEQILGVACRLGTVPAEEWFEEKPHDHRLPESSSIARDGKLMFPLRKHSSQIEVLVVDEDKLTSSERALVEMALNAYRRREDWAHSDNDDESLSYRLGEWIRRQMEAGLQPELPEPLAYRSSFYSTKIPILLYGEYPESKQVSYSELKKLLESFFEDEVTLIPLFDKEWLILSSESLLGSGEGPKDYDGDEPLEESLAAICSGLHEMLANEWIGESHLAITYPIVPAKSIIPAVQLLKETIALGRIYHVEDNLHFPWMLHLERLLHGISDAQKQQFMEQVLKRMDPFLEPETLTTLETFFELDCSVSETAKRLYIHRNTLLYRLDKLKQETGLDVRSFHDAVLIRIVLLLYKVTKRK